MDTSTNKIFSESRRVSASTKFKTAPIVDEIQLSFKLKFVCERYTIIDQESTYFVPMKRAFGMHGDVWYDPARLDPSSSCANLRRTTRQTFTKTRFNPMVILTVCRVIHP